MGIMKQYYLDQMQLEREQEMRDWFKDKFGYDPSDEEMVAMWADFEQSEELWWAMESGNE